MREEVPAFSFDANVFVYSGTGRAEVPDDVVRVRVDPSVALIPTRAFFERKRLTEVEHVKASWKLGIGPSVIATIRLPKSTPPTHSGGFLGM